MSSSAEINRPRHTLRTGGHHTRVLVLMGGPDAERDVSIMSGTEVARALRQHGLFDVKDLVVDRITKEEILSHHPEVIYPIVHGPWGEGGPLQEILEDLHLSDGIPYIGPKPRPAATAMNKLATKMHAVRLDIRTPKAREVRRREALDVVPPLVLKPSNDGSSVDLRICRTEIEAVRARAELEPRRELLMAEEYIEGREMTVGIVNGRVLPIIEIKPKTAFYDYQAKYFRDDTQYVVDPELPEAVKREMVDATAGIYSALHLRDIARADFMVNDAGAWFLEINTAPGMTTHSLVPMAARHIGIEMPELCASVVRAALSRDDDPNPTIKVVTPET